VAGSVVTALLVFAAVPAVLVTVVGDPLRGGLGHQWDHEARWAVSILAVVAWVAWAACCTQLIRAVVHQVRHGEIAPADGVGLTDRLAARIAIGILAMTTFGVPMVVASTTSGAASAVVSSTPAAQMVPSPTPPEAAPAASPAAALTYLVRPGDSLWAIADSQLGDGADWTAIASLNLGRTMPDGRRFVDPSLIHAGWDLILPATLGANSASVVDLSPPGQAPVTPTRPAPAPSTALTPSRQMVTPTTTASTQPAAPPTSAAPEHITGSATGSLDERRARPASRLPELVALGLGAIACAALARRARTRRLQQHSASAPHPGPPLSDAAVDADVLVQRFLDVPALHALERANCFLDRALGDADPRPREASVRAICVGTFGVDFWLNTPGLTPPGGCTLAEDGSAWHLPYREIDGHDLDRPALPIVLPIGEDDLGTWLLPVHPGACLPLLGPAGSDLWRAARRVQEAWAWSPMVTVTDDALVAERAVLLNGGGELPILFFGDPTHLSPEARAGVSVVTTSDAPATDVAVLVDRLGASIHPLGRIVRPNLMTIDTDRLMEELVGPVFAPPSATPDDPAPPDNAARALIENDRSAPMPVRMNDEGDPEAANDVTAASDTAQRELDAAFLVPGQVEVKLLTMTPRIDGLREALPPNRERRSIELVAYLALHRPDTVTSDRLRTRVLGSADADAAAKTLFNTATAARRSLGVDDQGRSLLPPGTRTGQYTVADGVTVDVQRAAGLAAIGNAAVDPDVAMAYLTEALGLIESEPLANALAGYTWWGSEGHAGQIAAVMVNAASNLAALAVDAGLFDLAQWGLEQARLLDPYSESLSRVAMQVAAAAGDADRLRREWRECQRRIDELDPGSSPSARTERLYGELAQQILV
jgi:DNA-binding SARP family transcriptional activator